MFIFYILIILFFLFLLMSYTSSELALVGARQEKIAGSKSRNKKLALKLMSGIEENLSVILVGTNICVVAMSTLTENLFSSFFENHNAFYSVMTDFALILLIGEIIPKAISKLNANTSILFLSHFIGFSSFLLKPLSVLFQKLSSSILNIAGVKEAQDNRASDLDDAIKDFSKGGMLPPHSRILEEGVGSLEKLKIYSVMRPRRETVFCREENGFEGALEAFRKTGHSKIVVVGENVDDVKGVYYIRDMVKKKSEKAREPVFIYDRASFITALEVFSEMTDDLAVCVDEYGQVTGILTRIDIIVRFADIFYLNEKNPFVTGRDESGNFIFKADTRISLLSDLYDVKTPSDYCESDYTIASFILDVNRSIPSPGETFKLGNLSLTIDESSIKGIKTVVVKTHDQK